MAVEFSPGKAFANRYNSVVVMINVYVIVGKVADAQESAVAIFVILKVGPDIALTVRIWGKEIVWGFGVLHQ
ncbi:MAG: hypothetical protein J6X59_02200 [Bacteroidales bacterium]|nr:hypothetical protein [Bacteroidales bacterium]